MENKEDVMDNYEKNVLKATPFIDIDIINEEDVDKSWKHVVRVGIIIRDWLYDQGVRKSFYFLWSGAGMHFRINENCFNKSIQEHHPLDIAFAVTEYILEKLKPQLLEAVKLSNYSIKIENLVAMKRVFTAPLSLHRRLDKVAVPLEPGQLEEFSIEWANPSNPRYSIDAWKNYVVGECDNLAYKALNTVGKAVKRTLLEARAAKIGIESGKQLKQPVQTQVSSKTGPGRFPVMALLQAARYYVLYKDVDRAKSFGLNRAIFYAWAKYYGPSKRPFSKASHHRIYGAKISEPTKWEEVAGEKVQISPRKLYVMGGVEQRPEDFDRYVARRFEEAGIPFEEAWRKALEYVKKFPRTILLDPRLFYKEVYEPVRDQFIDKIIKRRYEKKTTGLDKWIRINNREEE
ncbi:hypothetical protein [Staphylothermus hellenicus]|uniref:hypothetical protein n=1 Tax=Staphylothermus hellenicus TaxID=84599 RepID=UPI0001C4389E|nr:hypothetical protein [Staphylothermus hellenicus]